MKIELGSGEIGLKQAINPMILALTGNAFPLAATSAHLERMQQFQSVMQAQANEFGKTIRLCRFVFVEELAVIEPKRH